ncbi:putative choline dehydrogenase [Aspergillus recurvatus]
MHPHQALPRLAFAFSIWICGALTAPAQRDSNNLFDYVIVGGGNAGLTLASRLSETSTIRVAVIEAGTFYERATGNESTIPGNGGLYEGKAANITNPLVEWGFVTTPQAGLDNKSVHYPRGKTLGGCTALNAMNYERPNAGSMDLWAAVVNDPSYSWNNSLYYFQKSTDFTPPDMLTRFANSTPSYDPTVLAGGGELSLTHPNYAQPFSSWLAEAMPEVGIKHITGFQSGRLMGSGWPFLGRENLVVFDQMLVERILFQGNVARGVLVSDVASNRTFELLARREVIVSAGAFQSPQLLMISGVGPAGLLAEHGISLVAGRPGVGQNMHDHVLFGVTHEVNVATAYALRDPETAAGAAALYHEYQAGPLSNPGGDYAAFERLPRDFRGGLSAETEQALAVLPRDWPEVQYGLFPAYAGNFYDPYIGGPADGNYATLLAILVAPQSRGNISLSSSSVRDAPLINPAWLTHPADLELAVAAFKRLRGIFRAQALEGVLVLEEYYPGRNVTTDEQIVGHLRDAVYTMAHAAGTCRMGVEEDEMAVVDSVGRVFGTRNLRVVDASAFPFLPPKLKNPPIDMLAEKVSDAIKSTWR